MEPKFNTSFIPKKSLQEAVVNDVSRNLHTRNEVVGPMYLFTLLYFILVVGASLGFFMYTSLREKAVNTKLVDVESVRSQLKNDVVANLIATDIKLATIRGVLERHNALSGILPYLESLTLSNNIKYEKATYKSGLEKDGLRSEFEVAGHADSLETVAMQVDVYRKNPHVASVSLSNIARIEESKSVAFTITMILKKDALLLGNKERVGGGVMIGGGVENKEGALATSTNSTSSITKITPIATSTYATSTRP